MCLLGRPRIIDTHKALEFLVSSGCIYNIAIIPTYNQQHTPEDSYPSSKYFIGLHPKYYNSYTRIVMFTINSPPENTVRSKQRCLLKWHSNGKSNNIFPHKLSFSHKYIQHHQGKWTHTHRSSHLGNICGHGTHTELWPRQFQRGAISTSDIRSLYPLSPIHCLELLDNYFL